LLPGIYSGALIAGDAMLEVSIILLVVPLVFIFAVLFYVIGDTSILGSMSARVISSAGRKGAAKFETEHNSSSTDQNKLLSIDMKIPLNFKKICKFTFSKTIVFLTKN
jgi:positive regulator of sigma E activity